MHIEHRNEINEGVSMANQLAAIEHIVVLMLENRSFDHMLGFLYTDQQNQSPSGQAFDGLTGNESNPAANGEAVKVYDSAE
jgi:phospholipase C